jgi:prophage regulatory protein
VETELLLRLPEVIHMTGLARSTIYKLMGEGGFPSALKLTQRTVAWSVGDIQQWIVSRARSHRTPDRSPRVRPTTVAREAGVFYVRHKR